MSLPVNHHADHPGFSGVVAAGTALVLLATGGRVARLAADVAGVTAADRVVDVGCGPGNAVREAARRGAHAIGVDPAALMLRLARWVTRSADVDWVRGAAERLPIPDAAATVVWSLATVHHWKDVRAGLDEARRVLAPGGRLVAVERQVDAGATGLASHGWTRQQAESFAAHCRDAGFTGAEVEDRRARRRAVWVVRATRP
jgi:ubiquinone/menaquinone biosynthesis C-methylase UbiE